MWDKMTTGRMDGWLNIVTGLGLKNRDKKKATQAVYECPDQDHLETLYAASDIAEKFVDELPEEMVRKGFKIVQGDDADEDFDGEVQDKIRDLKAMERILEGMQWGRLYGGAIILMGIDDGRLPNEPVDMNNVKDIRWMQVFNRYELMPRDIQYDPTKPNFRRPETYQLQTTSNGTGITSNDNGYGPTAVIHHTRILSFHGSKLPWQLYRSNNYFHDSVLTKTEEVIKSYETSFEAAATFMHEFSQGVFKIKGLANMIASGQDEVVMKRLELVDMKKSIVRSIVIDADGEDFTREVPNLTGVSPLLEKMEKRLTAASKMPHTKLLGEGATGSLGGGGESENKNWYDHVSAQQNKVLKPVLERVLELLFASKECELDEPEKWDIEFNSLWEMSDSQNSDVRLKTAQTDQIYFQMGAVSEDEIALSRFGTGKYSMDTQLIEKRNIGEDDDIDEPEEEITPDVVDPDVPQV